MFGVGPSFATHVTPVGAIQVGWVWSNAVHGSSQHMGTSTSGTIPQAYIGTPDTLGDNSWYPDSEATHHLTNSAGTMEENSSYNGPGKVFVGNDTTLPILYIG